jgi:diaminopimelate decarboxylase
MTGERVRTLAARLGAERLESLAAEGRTSFYLIDSGKLRANVARMLSAFRAHYPNTAIAHSYKTNYVPYVSRLMLAEGAFAEVVSAMEFELALRAGAPPEQVILNGPWKSERLIEDALRAGVLVNADSLQEAELIRDVAGRNPDRTCRVGLRCNFPVPFLARSRFGIAADGPEVEQAAAILRACANVRLEGLHHHAGGDRSTESYRFRTARMIDLADRLFPDAPPRFIDVGGGFAGAMPAELAAQFPHRLPGFEEYAAAVAGRMAERFGSAPDGPQLIIEPGIGLFADAMEFVCRVAVLKEMDAEAHAVTTGTRYDVDPFRASFDLPVEVVHPPREAGRGRSWVLGGHTCMEADVMRRQFDADLRVGDFLVFSNVGAYAVVVRGPFISPAPAIFSVEEDGACALARRAASVDDVLAPYS